MKLKKLNDDVDIIKKKIEEYGKKYSEFGTVDENMKRMVEFIKYEIDNAIIDKIMVIYNAGSYSSEAIYHIIHGNTGIPIIGFNRIKDIWFVCFRSAEYCIKAHNKINHLFLNDKHIKFGLFQKSHCTFGFTYLRTSLKLKTLVKDVDYFKKEFERVNLENVKLKKKLIDLQTVVTKSNDKYVDFLNAKKELKESVFDTKVERLEKLKDEFINKIKNL